MAAPSAEDFQAQVDELVALTAILEPGLVRVLGPHSLFPSSASSSASAVAAEDLSGDFDPSSLYGAAPIAGIELQVLMEAQLPEGAEEIALHLRPQGDAPETACSAPIDHLPFLVLRVTFPAGYPSAEMPHARIAAPWLTQTAADAILEDLRLVWEEQGGPGLPVVFTWVEAIRARALDLTTSPGAVPVLVISPQTVAEPSRTEEEEDRPARGEEAGPSTGPGLDPDDRDWYVNAFFRLFICIAFLFELLRKREFPSHRSSVLIFPPFFCFLYTHKKRSGPAPSSSSSPSWPITSGARPSYSRP